MRIANELKKQYISVLKAFNDKNELYSKALIEKINNIQNCAEGSSDLNKKIISDLFELKKQLKAIRNDKELSAVWFGAQSAIMMFDSANEHARRIKSPISKGKMLISLGIFKYFRRVNDIKENTVKTHGELAALVTNDALPALSRCSDECDVVMNDAAKLHAATARTSVKRKLALFAEDGQLTASPLHKRARSEVKPVITEQAGAHRVLFHPRKKKPKKSFITAASPDYVVPSMIKRNFFDGRYHIHIDWHAKRASKIEAVNEKEGKSRVLAK